MTTNTTDAQPTFRVPGIIKRNITLFALSQSFTGAGMQLAYSFGPLMVFTLTGSASLAGIPVALVGLSRFMIAYTAGRVTDRYGRRPGIMLGLMLALVGGLIAGSSMNLDSIWVFIVGLLIFGMGMNAAQQLRVAATDMFPPNRRGQALGLVALGSLFGLFMNPILVATSQNLSVSSTIHELGLPWFMLPALILPGMVMIYFVRPDPKEIGMNLADYYPGYKAPPRPAGDVKFRPVSLYRNVTTRLAIVSNCAGQANMSIVMVMTSLVLSHQGHSLTAIALSHMFHTAGMFAFTIPLGRLGDKIGRESVMYPGILTALVGAGLVSFTGVYWGVTLGTFLVGLGWAGANVSATGLIADQVETHERGRAIGVNDTFSGATAVVMALTIGPLIEGYGLPAAGYVAIIAVVPPLVMVVALRGARREAHAAAEPGE